MASTPEDWDNRTPQLETVADLFHETVQRLLHDNVEFLLSASLGHRRNVEVLHLIDAQPQTRVRLGYHCVYEAFDSVRQATTHGIFIANPWTRPRYEPRQESRHYFDGGRQLVVREDNRAEREFEFLRGSTRLEDIDEPEDANALTEFFNDLDRIQASQPIKPMSLKFDQFARLK